MTTEKNLLEINNLQVYFHLSGGGLLDRIMGSKPRTVKAVDDVSFNIKKGETLGLVGESGCGKSTTGRAILQLVKPTGGQIIFQGKDLAQLPNQQMRPFRRHLQMIFQNPYASLNPRMTVKDIIAEPLTVFNNLAGIELDRQVQNLMEKVGLNPQFIKRYPHEFSGGQRQRIGIARALALNPDFIVADEPIAALDVSIQAQIMNLLQQLQKDLSLTYLFISHDLRAVRYMSNRVAVMYLGKIVELAEASEIYQKPLHPYTQALISAVPVPDPVAEKKRQRIVLQGDVPSPLNPPSGCRFHTRCPQVMAECKTNEPKFVNIGNNHYVACFLANK
ncbi:MAG: dipeptide ABC transporter ATP-binding protein [Blastocatellia bacterium]|nr:dipeptide ABC transporter ATP-binding protein [Blastocatellia bacterium]MBL8197199.1 dipeptide ABC transporter ATP-binding protein [Blastocatellia bacterium]MBN8722047.1 dipeptide ABC transporter ATP-binding protein [Acidobacteriota bacterium]